MAHKSNQTPPLTCTHCNSSSFIKNGWVKKAQRYKCKSCHKNFSSSSLSPTTSLYKDDSQPPCFFYKMKKKMRSLYKRLGL